MQILLPQLVQKVWRYWEVLHSKGVVAATGVVLLRDSTPLLIAVTT
jgi:hypothetical protein